MDKIVYKKVENIKLALKEQIITECFTIVNNSNKLFNKIGYVDHLEPNLIQHIFTGMYLGMNKNLVLVEHEESEACKNLFLHNINDLSTLENILNGLSHYSE